MKRIFTMALLALAAWSCAIAQDIQFTVTGKATPGTDSLYVCYDNNMREAEVIRVADGTFTVSGTKPKNTFIVFIEGRTARLAAVIDAANISVDFNSVEVKGSPINDIFSAYQKKTSVLDKQVSDLYAEYRKLKGQDTDEAKASMKALEQKLDEIDKQQTAEAKAFVEANKTNVLPAYAISSNYYGYEYAELKALCAEGTAYHDHPLMARPIKHVASLAKRQTGLHYTDLAMQDLDGNAAKLSQWVGKGYLLVDFWASWCGPCRMEMPYVKAAYDKFHGKGFEIVGVSFDSKADAWQKAVKDLNLNWPHISDLKGWKCAASEAYGVNSIPSNVLLDKDGVIVAADLRGEDLTAKLAELYK